MGCILSTNTKLNLSDFDINNTNEFSLNNLFIETRVISIYDGDTCTCIIPVHNNFYKFNIRLADIDTCEMTSKNSDAKQLSLEARKRLCNLISPDFKDIDLNISKKELIKKLNEKCYLIKIKCGDFDKYGRLLGWLYDNNSTINSPIEQSFNHILIKEHLAYKYEGKTKLTEQEQITLLNQN